MTAANLNTKTVWYYYADAIIWLWYCDTDRLQKVYQYKQLTSLLKIKADRSSK